MGPEHASAVIVVLKSFLLFGVAPSPASLAPRLAPSNRAARQSFSACALHFSHQSGIRPHRLSEISLAVSRSARVVRGGLRPLRLTRHSAASSRRLPLCSGCARRILGPCFSPPPAPFGLCAALDSSATCSKPEYPSAFPFDHCLLGKSTDRVTEFGNAHGKTCQSSALES